jgi:hypothetical protein
MVFADSAARTTALSGVLAEGMMSYLQDTNSVEVYNGTSWVALASGDVTEVQAGTGISVASGTGPIPVVTNTMATTFDAKGDLVAGTGADTFAKLTVGANDTVLTADSSTATGLKWAAAASGGGMTLLSTTTLSGASTTISSISGSYNQLYAVIYGVNGTNTGFEMAIEPNATNNISTGAYMQNANSVAAVGFRTASTISISALNANNTNNATTLIIDNYASSTNYKPFTYYGYVTQSGGAGVQASMLSGAILTNSAITSLKFSCLVTGTFNAGTVLLYGVK